MARFVARYKDPDDEFQLAAAGVQIFDANSKDEVLEIARSYEAPNHQLAFIMIDELGTPNQVWNAMRAARPEQNGDGWCNATLRLFRGVFPTPRA
jgi:hypothetical protein